jgi:hypothetical protein
LASISAELALSLFITLSLIASIFTIFVVEDLRRTNFSKIQHKVEVSHREELLKKFDQD